MRQLYKNKVSLISALHVVTSYFILNNWCLRTRIMDFLPNNPFLEDLVDVQQQPPLQPGYQRRCKLPDFWPSNPVLWFARAEFNFEVAGVVTEREKFMHTANALPYDALTLVADLVTQPPAVQPFQRLKERLLLSHQLTIVQMAEKILDMPELGDRRPSQLLAAMMEFCPEGEVNSAFFRASFLRRLPKEIRVLLTDEVRGDLKDLAVRADELFQHHRSSPIAALDDTVDTELAEAVAALAVRAGKGKFGGGKKKQDGDSSHSGSGGGGKSGGGKSGGGGGRSYFVCDRHWQYGSKAYRCDAPQKCQWSSEN